MSAVSMPAPGTELGPCADPCPHTDCADSRRMADAACHLCLESIGYERRFCADESGRLVHLACLYDRERPVPA